MEVDCSKCFEKEWEKDGWKDRHAQATGWFERHEINTACSEHLLTTFARRVQMPIDLCFAWGDR